MIKIENVSVAGFEAAVRGMRNPLNSWTKSDSHVGLAGSKWKYDPGYIIGQADKELMLKLAKGGSVHAKYRRQIVVWCDITAPTYFLKDLDTYKVGTVRNSTSTMHKLHSRDLTREDFSYEHLLEPSEDSLTAVTVDGEICHYSPIGMLDMTIKTLNHFRQKFVETGDKTYWWQMIQLLPMSYNYRSTFTFNYEVLAAIYRDRKDHKLDEWRDMCKWIKELPYSWIITGDVGEEREHAPLLDPVIGPPDEVKYFVCMADKDSIPYDRSMRIVGWNRGSLWFEEEKVGDMMALDDIVPEGRVKLTYALKDGHECLSGTRLVDFNFGFTVNSEEDELQLRLWRKE